MIDWIESKENAAERWADENMTADKFKCPGCDKWTSLDDAHVMTLDPWGLPACRACLLEAYPQLADQEDAE